MEIFKIPAKQLPDTLKVGLVGFLNKEIVVTEDGPLLVVLDEAVR
jgi:hypothetical protein